MLNIYLHQYNFDISQKKRETEENNDDDERSTNKQLKKKKFSEHLLFVRNRQNRKGK